MENHFITENTIYDNRFYNKFVNFNFDAIARERKYFLENTSPSELQVCVPITLTSKLNILQIIALKKAKELSKQLNVTILIKNSRSEGTNEFIKKINSKFDFPEESFVKQDEIEKFHKQSLLIIKKFEDEELNIETQNYLIYISKLLLFLREKKIGVFMVGQNEAFLFEAIIRALNPKPDQFKYYPLYIPELLLFKKNIIIEGDTIGTIKIFFHNVLYQYRSKDNGMIDLLVIASYFNLRLEDSIDAIIDKLSKEIHNLLTF